MDSKAKVLSITRSITRYALSSILYHRLCRPVRVEVECDGKTNKEENTTPTSMDSLSCRPLDHCFVDRDFCGVKLKFIDAVDHNDTIKNTNGKFPLLVSRVESRSIELMSMSFYYIMTFS